MTPKRRHVDKGNSTIAGRGDYTQTLEAILAGGFCPFCETHLFKHHRKPLLHKTKYWLVTENSWPYEGTKYHFLFIARRHIEAAEMASPVMWMDLQKLYKKLVKEHGIKGASLVLRSGDTRYTGASVSHLHAHLISGGPRKKKSESIKALVAFRK
jgi:diadenosine tetraphosphate (Ap4A) HIT family hydrolase